MTLESTDEGADEQGRGLGEGEEQYRGSEGGSLYESRWYKGVAGGSMSS